LGAEFLVLATVSAFGDLAPRARPARHGQSPGSEQAYEKQKSAQHSTTNSSHLTVTPTAPVCGVPLNVQIALIINAERVIILNEAEVDNLHVTDDDHIVSSPGG
jgi:hypothetical protein